ncbi:MAG: sugar ABC transporter substrate-binding protein [Dictyoglomi bacterium]|jgi:multiple sugar transport system substrate-binding protein|nr:sugar ABC transporter substrate-binding protein [Dictyoglomota bacterium]
MKYFKSVLSLMLAVLLSIGLFGQLAFSKDPVTITFWVNHGIEDEPLFKKVIANFEKANPDIKVDFLNVAAGTDYYQKLTVMFAAGTLPDVFYMRGGSGDMIYYKQGYAADITNLVKRDSKEINLDDFLKSQQVELQYPRGRWRALPYDYSTYGIYYNKSLFDQAGISYPKNTWTWDDVLQASIKLTKRDDRGRTIQWGINNLGIISQWLEGMVMTEGGRIFDANYTKCVLDSPQNVKIFQKWADFYLKYHVAPQPGEVSGQENPYFTGRAGMTVDGSWATLTHRRLCGFPFDVVMMPQSKTGKRIASATGGSWAISHNTKNLEAAWKFVKYLTSPEASRILIVDPIRSLPSRKSLIPEWSAKIKEEGLDPQSAQIFGDQVTKYGKNTPTVSINYMFVINNELPLMFTGKRSVEDCLKSMTNAINKMFEEERKK